MTEAVAAVPPPTAPPQFAGSAVGTVRGRLRGLVTAVLSALVWHSTRLSGPDAWVFHLLGAHDGELQLQLVVGIDLAVVEDALAAGQRIHPVARARDGVVVERRLHLNALPHRVGAIHRAAVAMAW